PPGARHHRHRLSCPDVGRTGRDRRDGAAMPGTTAFRLLLTITFPRQIFRKGVMSTPVHDLIIVGSGPAGYTAAVYAARADLQPLLFEGTQFGGALMTTTEVENFPGFRAGIMGPDLMEEMREQAKRFGADIRTEDVEALDLTGPVK